MAGRRLVDAAQIFSASRTIARHHVQIRSEQFDLWSKTSSLAKAAKEQAVSVGHAARAANALAHRFAEQRPRPDDAPSRPTPQGKPVQQQPTANEYDLNQDLYYRPSNHYAPTETLNDEGFNTPHRHLNIRQSTSSSSHNAEDDRARIDSDVTTNREDVERHHSSKNGAMNPEKQLQREDVHPGGINTDVFRSPRISKMMGQQRSDDAVPMRKEENAANVERDVLQQREQEGQAVHRSRRRPSNAVEMHTPTKDLATDASTGLEHDPKDHHSNEEELRGLAKDLANDAGNNAESNAPELAYEMRESRVPSSRLGRIWEYGGLATSMAFGAVSETFRRATGSRAGEGSLFLSEGNMERLVATLSRMRGAALKLGQMISFQDLKMLPGPIHEILERLQDNADYMPAWQRDRVLSSNLGSDWRKLFSNFEEKPFAAASIGQVHRAKLVTDGREVAVKIQYPGVASSISSDLNNLSILLTASRLLPKGLYLDKTIANARKELAWETDYKREADSQERFRHLLRGSRDYIVPAVVREASGDQVLTASFMHGTAVTKPSLDLTQEERDWIGTNILRLCLRELMEFKFMQTDPNWTNFLYNRQTEKLELLDFGASRDFPDSFVDPYVETLIAATEGDSQTVRDLSVQLGYLTGYESEAMVDAHVMSVLTLAEPFRPTNQSYFDFRDQKITDKVRSFIPVMLRERLSPPPEETYSLHRKLSGAFLLLARLGSRVDCRHLFVTEVGQWKAAKGGTSQPPDNEKT